MLEFNFISDSSSPYFQRALEIYVDSFPANERQPIEKIRQWVDCGDYRLIAARQGDDLLGFSLLRLFENADFALLDYFAIARHHRGQGVGSALFRRTSDFALTEVPVSFMLLEVEDPAFGSQSEKSARQRRVGFYKRFGGRVVKNFQYLLPPLAGGGPANMLLMVCDGGRGVAMDNPKVMDIVTSVYRDMYGRGVDDSLLCRMRDALSATEVYVEEPVI